MIYLIHIGIDCRTPSRSPNFERTRCEFGKSGRVCFNFYLPTETVKNLRCLLEYRVSRVIGDRRTGYGKFDFGIYGRRIMFFRFCYKVVDFFLSGVHTRPLSVVVIVLF